jgi:hypothetical protein
MAEILDEFVITLGLDPTKLTKGQQEALASLKKTNEAALATGKNIEAAAKRQTEALTQLRDSAVSIFAAAAGGKGFIDFANGIARADAAVGRLSRGLGQSTGLISSFQYAARLYGSTAENMAGSFQALSDAFTAFGLGGPEGPAVMATLRGINTEAERLDKNRAATIGGNESMGEFYRKLATNLEIIQRLGQPNEASYLARKLPGMDPGFFDLLATGPANLEKVLGDMDKIGTVTKKAADAAGDLEKHFADLEHRSESLYRKLMDGPVGRAMFGISNAGQNDIEQLMNIGNDPMGTLKYFFWNGRPLNEGTIPKTSDTPTSGAGAFTSQAEKEAFIRSAAAARGQNPDVWVALAKGEGFNQYKGDPDATGAATSFGAFQLHYPGIGRNTADGLGTLFTKQTGLDARDPATERRQIEWSIDYARTNGLTDWHGWHGSKFANLSGGGSTSTQTVNITGPITVTGVASPADFANKLRDVGLKRQAEANQSSVGAQ